MIAVFALAVSEGSGLTAGQTGQARTTQSSMDGVWQPVTEEARLVAPAGRLLPDYADAATDPYTGNDSGALLTENQTNLTAAIGAANYDIGHVLTAAVGGGIAALSSVCSPNRKARGMTGSTVPVGDGFVVDFVAHELGHQFGGSHTYNADRGNCDTRNASAAFEPASGSTIMAYGGVCSLDDLVTASHDNFHVRSLEEITAALNDPAIGGSCGTVASPRSTVTTNFRIPMIPRGLPCRASRGSSPGMPRMPRRIRRRIRCCWPPGRRARTISERSSPAISWRTAPGGAGR